MASPQFSAALLRPKYWLTWLGFGLWYLLSLLPYRVQIRLGGWLGRVFYRFVSRRREIARCNIQLCFPQLSAQECDAMVRRVMDSIGIAFFETGMAWFWPVKRFQRWHRVEGVEHLERALQEGVGVVLMAMHFTHIDIGAKLMSLAFSIDGSYRPHNNPVYDFVQRYGRERFSRGGRALPREDVRGIVKALRSGRAIWYAPDQDYGPKHSVFVPFFGIPAATITATSQFARLGKAKVIPFTQTRCQDGSGYLVKVHAPIENYPSGDDEADALRINQVVEQCILEQPDQYLWVHRRFKTRPEGEPDLYAAHGIGKKNGRPRVN